MIVALDRTLRTDLLKQLEYSLCLLAWYEGQKFEEGIKRARAKLYALQKPVAL